MPNLEQEFKNFSISIRKQVDKVIDQILTSGIDQKFKPLVGYQMKTGGKRIRPVLTVLSCLALGGKQKNSLPAAAALELTHNYTLIVDDIIDNGKLRRNLATTPAKYGSAIADCIAIYYACSIFQAASLNSHSQQTVEAIALALKNLTSGEILDILFERAGRKDQPFVLKKRPDNVSKNQYFKMISKKTAALFSASCYLGGLSANAAPAQLAVLKNFGLFIGICFQLTDDLLDIFGDEQKFGKKIGKDIEERKGGNIVLLLAKQELISADKKWLEKTMQQEKINSNDIRKAIAMIKKTKAQARAQKLADQYSQKAIVELQKLPASKYTEFLHLIARKIPCRTS